MFIYFRDRERETERDRDSTTRRAEREGDTESEAAPGSELSAQSPTWGHEPRNHEIMT